ncbi:MAG: alpha/beta fold hydrolase [Cocleimonas sp.]
MQIFKHIIILITLLVSLNASAKTIVLVHGYMSDGMSWRTSGFTKPLELAGYQDAGNYGYSPWGITLPHSLNYKGDVFVTVNLPSKANLQNQEGVLVQYLQHLYAYRYEPLTLIGHSAGGLTARLYVIDPEHLPVEGLITIASPHLGTPAANVAYLAGSSPIGMMASMSGVDVLRDSRGLFSDLKEEKPSNFLYWMNHQPHPQIHYASIIRKNAKISKPNKFDFVVPPNSQDMNNIWALQKRSGIAMTLENHSINGKDGSMVVEILKHIK